MGCENSGRGYRADPAYYIAHTDAPESADPVERTAMTTRAGAAAARFLRPIEETGPAGRVGQIRQETPLVWGAADRVVAAGYRK